MELRTDRLLLRRWRESDLAAFSAINQDPSVMRYFPSMLSEVESAAMVERIEQGFEEHGFGLFCAELIESEECIGFIGLNVPRLQLPFTPCVEIGWRLASAHHGKGLATEGALRVRDWAIEEGQVPNLLSYTSALNLSSQNVMRKIGLVRDTAGDFLHPALPEGHPLRPHVLFRLPTASIA